MTKADISEDARIGAQARLVKESPQQGSDDTRDGVRKEEDKPKDLLEGRLFHVEQERQDECEAERQWDIDSSEKEDPFQASDECRVLQDCDVVRETRGRGHVDGVILTLPHSRESLLGWLGAKDIPVVVLGRPFRRQRDFSWVATDDRKASREVVRYRKSKCYLPTATVTGPLDTTSGRDRLAGYKQALGTAFRGDLVVTGDWSLRSGRLAVDELLHRAAPFRAIFVASDLMAVGATLALGEAGKRVPQDVAIVGFDDSSAATITEPATHNGALPPRRYRLESPPNS
jgi:hypothetical protein